MNYENQKVIPVDIGNEMQKSFIDYAMSVIVGRALPDVRDGLKPVHRRILYTMFEDGLVYEKSFYKAATTVGSVLGRYHPHGDAAVYDSLVRMAQDFSLRYPLIDGHGNFGSIDGDPPAAYRYTEARMSKIAAQMLTDIEKNTVDFIPNFDEKRKEPTVLPSRYPNLLVNGSSGIAVAMATNIPPHNLNEVIDATCHLIDNPEAEITDLMEFVKAPDFPTGGLIVGTSGVRQAYHTGKGRCIVRARAEIVEVKDKMRIHITEIPYMVNKTRILEQMVDCVKDKRIEGISYIEDESGRNGMKIRVDLKRDANPQVVLNQLYKYTQLQDTCSMNMLAIVNGEPKTLTLKDFLVNYVDFQVQIIERRTQFDLKKAKDRSHILEGLRIAIDNIDAVIKTIREGYSGARERLMDRFSLSEIQAKAILEMQLGRLEGIERDKIDKEYNTLQEKIAYFEEILASREKVNSIIKEELLEIKKKYGDDRRSTIEINYDEIDLEDLIEKEDCVITRTHFGYIKRCPVSTYRSQHRGGRGISAMSTREEDFVEDIFVANTHSFILFFTDKGRMYRLKGYNLPEASRTAKGSNMVNLLPIEQGEKITTVIHLDEFEEDKFLTMVTKNGVIKRTPLGEYNSSRKGGRNAIVLDEDDELVNVRITSGSDVILLASKNGKATKFAEEDVRCVGRVTRGVRGMRLDEGDSIIAMSLCNEDSNLLTVTENGYGKRTATSEYKIQNRGGKGMLNYNITEKTGNVVGALVAEDVDDIMLVSNDGVIIRMDAAEVPIYSRVTQGVRLMRLAEGVSLVKIARTDKDDSGEDSGEENSYEENSYEEEGSGADENGADIVEGTVTGTVTEE